MATEAITRFFQSPYFAVAGASQDPSKYGYKVLNWYHTHNLPVTPLNPTNPQITLPALSSSNSPTILPTLASVLNLPHPKETSLSIITPPAVTRAVLVQAKEAGIRGVWMQPGSFDAEGLAYAKREFEVGVGGNEECVLVDGGEGMRSAARKKGVGKKEVW